jgi:hypothetical protein
MSATMCQFLAEDRLRTLHGEAERGRPVELARQASKARSDDQAGRSGVRFEFVRRLVARLATA